MFDFMASSASIKSSNLGPLEALVGTWIGEGIDTSPPGQAQFIEQLVVAAGPPVRLMNKKITYSVCYVRDIYTKPETGKEIRPIHDETGYWLWVPDENRTIIRQFVIPRGITIMAGGQANLGDTTLSVAAKKGQTTYGILDAPYMEVIAPTVEFSCKFSVTGDTLEYEELSVLEVNGKRFDHTDVAKLKRYV